MIKKIKDMVELSEKVSEVNEKLDVSVNKFDNIVDKISLLSGKIDELSSNVSGLEKEQRQMGEKVHQEISDLEEKGKRFEMMLNEFSLLKARLPEIVSDEIHKILKPQVEGLKTDVKQFDMLNDSLKDVNRNISNVNSDILKCEKISRKVREMDFNLINYQKKLDSEDRNKLKLMGEVDNLKKLIAKERRNRHR